MGRVDRTRGMEDGDTCPRGGGHMSRRGVVRGRIRMSQVFIKMRTYVPVVGDICPGLGCATGFRGLWGMMSAMSLYIGTLPRSGLGMSPATRRRKQSVAAGSVGGRSGGAASAGSGGGGRAGWRGRFGFWGFGRGCWSGDGLLRR